MIRHVVKTEGIAKLYTGCSTLIVGTMFKASVRFLSFDTIKNSLANDKGQLSKRNGVLAGMVAGCVESAVAVTPTERIKTALIDDAKGAKRFRGVSHGISLLIREQGIGTFYRGLISTTLKQASTSAVRMGSYNALRETCKANGVPTNSLVTFGIGSIAGVVTVYTTQPFDTVKTRVQSAAGSSMAEAVKSVLREDGIRGMWKGSTMRLGRLVLSGGIVFTVYEWVAGVLTSSKIHTFR
ncbi:Mitochondrial carrier domain protein [Niveomyces insectorum RCEF 264]|uniref:Mitochondrial carrier domain protein n=1 Tax=Niveomyces insectorum RCEF 264 TaxID=1081102 RepID=A0A167RTN3_9HYPO|nr:Mitochondrial carrier domain protein [Niveomyces insectorum RCEF 264]